MTREEAIKAALAELDRIGCELSSREPCSARFKKRRMIEDSKASGWSMAFSTPVPEDPDVMMDAGQDMIMVEVYEPDGRVVVYQQF